MQRFDLSWRIRHFVFRHVLILTAIWFTIVVVAVQGFALTPQCTDALSGSRSVLGAVQWFVPDYGGAR